MLKKINASAELEEECSSVELKAIGTIPEWLSGTLIRNGPVTVQVNGKTNSHWFDGIAMLHAFTFNHGKTVYSNKFLRSNAYDIVFKKGSLNYDGFAIDPCRSLFKRFFTILFPQSLSYIHNANVNVAKIADEYVALTETPLPVKFDPETLETLGVLDYQDGLPKSKCWESAHPHTNLSKNSIVNYLIKFGRQSFYTFYEVKKKLAKRNIIAEVPVENPAYMHSFAATTNYLILTEFPLVVKPLDLITKNKAFIKNFTWQPERGTRFIVVNRHKGSVVGTYVTKPFFAFHHANAFEENGKIYLDIVSYENADLITKGGFDLDVNAKAKQFFPSKLERFSLSLQSGKITSEVLLHDSNEFPRINEKMDGMPYRYLYLVAFIEKGQKDSVLDSEGLYKFDIKTKHVLEWKKRGCASGEPVFVSSPGGLQEDDGIVLSVVHDQINKYSFLLVLDAKTFKEIGRVEAPHIIPEGLHGQFF